MKKLLLFVSVCLLFACNSKKEEGGKEMAGEKKSMADSLMEQVMDGHDVGMAKYGKMQGYKKQIDALLDSISKLPAKAKEAAAPYQEKLQSTGQELATALAQMDKWMEEFNMDSAANDMEKRILYLAEEKDKVGKVKSLILETVGKADSLLRK